MHKLSTHSLCALCVGQFKPSVLVDINSDAGAASHLKEMLTQYIPFPILQILQSSPLCICDVCLKNLQTWHSFVSKCKEAQEALIEKLKKADPNCQLEFPLKQDEATERTLLVRLPLKLPNESSCPTKLKKSSNYCIARWCNNGNYRGVSLFRIPKERDRALAWLAAAERSDLRHSKRLNNHYLCAHHFAPRMFTNKSCNKLVKKAIPTIFHKPSCAEKISEKEATAQNMPRSLMGVPLKTILPKIIEDKIKSRVMGGFVHTITENQDQTCVLPSKLTSILPPSNVVKSAGVCTSGLSSNVISSSSSTIKQEEGQSHIETVLCASLPVNLSWNFETDSCGTSQHTNSQCNETISVSAVHSKVPFAPLKPKDRTLSILKEEKKGTSPSNFTTEAAHLKSLLSSERQETFVEGCDIFSSNEMSPSTAGSQDFLLTHLVNKIGKPVSTFQDRNIALNCDLSLDSSHTCQQVPSHDIELGTSQNMFDIQTDDARENANYMHLDDLMDLDRFFESR